MSGHHLKASARTTSTGAVLSSAATVVGIHWVASTGGAGRITIRDDGATGTILIDIDTPASAEGDSMMFPEPGVKFDTDVHISALTNVDAITVVYQD